jgi:hypothetical protein
LCLDVILELIPRQKTIDERVEIPVDKGSDLDSYDDEDEDDSDSLYVQSFLFTNWVCPPT